MSLTYCTTGASRQDATLFYFPALTHDDAPDLQQLYRSHSLDLHALAMTQRYTFGVFRPLCLFSKALGMTFNIVVQSTVDLISVKLLFVMAPFYSLLLYRLCKYHYPSPSSITTSHVSKSDNFSHTAGVILYHHGRLHVSM